MKHHHLFIRRCFDLARLGADGVSPNPLVGAVLVHENRIIGEGWHRQYGKAHAEVNAVENVRPEDRHLLSQSTLYVSLEPCCIHRNTPPCTDLILQFGIPKVVISCLDHTPEVNGKGVEILLRAGVEVITGILEEEGKRLSRIRNAFVTQRRPFVLLKFAQTQDGFLGRDGEQVWVSNQYSKRFVHKCRAEIDAILVGTRTAEVDNPQLTNRLWFGKSPLRIVFDRNLRLPIGNHLFCDGGKTWVVTEKEVPQGGETGSENLAFITLPFDENLLPKLLKKLAEHRISSLIVEGGAATLRGFIAANYWDEAWVFTGNLTLGSGIKAPKIPGMMTAETRIGTDVLTFFANPAAQPLNL